MYESYRKKYVLQMTVRSIDAANRVLLRASVDFIKIPAQQAYLPVSTCKKEKGADHLGGQ